MSQNYEDMQYGDPLVESLVRFIADAEFQQEFERFFVDNCRAFEDDQEHRLEYTDIYNDFKQIFDTRIEEFCAKEDVSPAEFFRRCEASQAQDVKARHYIDVMLSSTDYLQFVALMKVMKGMHGARLDREDLNAEGEEEISRMLKEKKPKKKKKKKSSAAGEGKEEDDDDDDDGLDSEEKEDLPPAASEESKSKQMLRRMSSEGAHSNYSNESAPDSEGLDGLHIAESKDNRK
ncbi:hypothetical protein TrVE_jg8284 [Triparma verrucosa]|uniref:Cilia- and flagella-associated protein 36 n=1 Tax=Triparma verrucosa TaxID=1606542 RepID=A0A9W6Z8I9_9STRA|nr:hypothetical protein TrVE_jg8284 [Triparma verrucosa]